MDQKQNVTLSLPRALLERVKRAAAERDTSVSAPVAEALGRLADEDRRYVVARKRAMAALRSPCSLGTHGRRGWSRDDCMNAAPQRELVDANVLVYAFDASAARKQPAARRRTSRDLIPISRFTA